MIAAGWFLPAQAAYLGAFNFAGYFAGALAASRLARLSLPNVARAMMLLAGVAFFACAEPLPFAWFAAWRCAAGFAGGVLMVLAAPGVLAVVPAARRGLAGGVVFTGVGIGIALSGTLIPPLLRLGLSDVWLGMGGLSLLLTALAWGGWPRQASVAASPSAARGGRKLWGVVVAYGLNAVGLVPHMVFLVDYVARGLGRGLAAGSLCWVAFGVGALIGPVCAGALADRIGFVAAFRLALLIQAATVAVPLASTAMPALLTSAAVAGVFAPGIVTLAIGRIHLLSPSGSSAARAGWRLATIAWALGQAVAAYGLSYVYALTGSYAPLFAAGCVMLLVALAVDRMVSQTGRRAVAG